MSGVDRRTFIKASALAAASTYIAPAVEAWRVEQGSVETTTPLSTFRYSDVELLDGPMKRQFDELHARFLNIDDDRL